MEGRGKDETEGGLGAPPAERAEDRAPQKMGSGIEILDTPEYLDGGFTAGSVVTLIADPVATAELFLHDLAATRYTNYFTTAKPKESVETTLRMMGRPSDNYRINDIYSSDDPIVTSIMSLDEVSQNENIIFDNFSDIAMMDGYERILNKIYTVSHATESLTYLYLIKSSGETFSHAEKKVPYMSDVVMEVTTGISGEKVENRLSITKLRGQRPPEKTIKLNIGEEIVVDTSRDIA